MMVGTLFNGWGVTFGTARSGLGGVPTSQPINYYQNYYYYYYYWYIHLMAFFQDNLGNPVPER